MAKKRILIICGYKLRELESLLLLKKALENNLQAKVKIVGGISELQRMYFHMYIFKPDIVFLSQVVEKACRKIAAYVIKSGGQIAILPAEITVTAIIADLLINPSISYNQYISKIFIPGQRYKELLERTDIEPEKIAIVGSPKLDRLVTFKGSAFFSKQAFSTVYNIPKRKKNIFIFTSFVEAVETYFSQDEALKLSLKKMLISNKCIEETQKSYVITIRKLCKKFQNFNFILKPHPLENFEVFTSITESNFLLVSECSIDNCLRSIDLAIHWNSTVSTECWIKNIPTIQYSPYKKYDIFLAENRFGNPLVRSASELENAILKYINQPLEKKYQLSQRRYLSENYYKVDGDSGSRIAFEIRKMLLHHNKQKYLIEFNLLFILVIIMEIFFKHDQIQAVLSKFFRNYDSDTTIKNYVYIE